MAKYHKFNILSSKKVGKSPTVREAVSNFLISKKSMNCTPKTVRSYTDTLKPFLTFCSLQGVTQLENIDKLIAKMIRGKMKITVINDSWYILFCLYRKVRII